MRNRCCQLLGTPHCTRAGQWLGTQCLWVRNTAIVDCCYTTINPSCLLISRRVFKTLRCIFFTFWITFKSSYQLLLYTCRYLELLCFSGILKESKMSDRRTEWHTPIANDGFQVYFIRKFEKCPIVSNPKTILIFVFISLYFHPAFNIVQLTPPSPNVAECSRGYLNLKGRRTDNGENCIMMNFITYILHRILLRWLN
jgi:hypothetical protein